MSQETAVLVDSSDEESVMMPPPSPASTTAVKGKGAKKAPLPSQVGRSRNWCFTLNNYVPEDVEALSEMFKESATYAVIGKEVGKEGTPHLQGTVVWKNARTFKTTKASLGRAHVEETKFLQESIEYCKKEGNFLEIGVRPMDAKAKGAKGGQKEKDRWDFALEAAKAGRFEDIDAQIQLVHAKQCDYIYARELRTMNLTNTFEPMEWWYGPTGSGKSRLARESNPGAFVKMLNKWWDGYVGEEVVILDDVDPESCGHMAHFFKTWTDHYPFPCEIKGTSTRIRPRKFVVTSNYSLEECFPRQQDYEPLMRRFNVRRFVYDGEPVLEHARGATAAMPVLFVKPPSLPPQMLERRAPLPRCDTPTPMSRLLKAVANKVLEESDCEEEVSDTES